jgi:hypothetical protein
MSSKIQMMQLHPPSPKPLKAFPKPPLPFPQQHKRSRMSIQLHPLSLPEQPPPQLVAAKSLIKSSILSTDMTGNLFTILIYVVVLGQFPNNRFFI